MSSVERAERMSGYARVMVGMKGASAELESSPTLTMTAKGKGKRAAPTEVTEGSSSSAGPSKRLRSSRTSAATPPVAAPSSGDDALSESTGPSAISGQSNGEFLLISLWTGVLLKSARTTSAPPAPDRPTFKDSSTQTTPTFRAASLPPLDGVGPVPPHQRIRSADYWKTDGNVVLLCPYPSTVHLD